jgi:hypothetical protein
MDVGWYEWNWNPVLESHQPLRFCKPPPALIGQRDEKMWSNLNADACLSRTL